jgi:O-antigen ligase
MKALLVPAIPGIVALGLWALLDLQRFLCVAVLATMIYPNALVSPGGTQVAIADVLLVVATGAWIVTNAVGTERGPWIARNRMALPLVLFVCLNLGSIAWSSSPHATLIFAVQLVEIAILLPLAFGSIPRSMDVIRQGQNVFMFASAALGVAAFVAYLPHAAKGDTQGIYLWGIHKNAIGSFTGAGLVLAYTLLLENHRPGRRWMLALLMLAELSGLFSSVSRGAILGSLIAVIAVSFALKRGRVASLLTVGLAAAVFLIAIGPASRGQKKDASGSYDSSVVRKYSFSHAVDKIQAHPLLGTGAGTYSDYIPQLNIGVADPNNMFLLTWSEIGIVGIAALLFLLYEFAALFVRVSRGPPDLAVPAVAAGGVALSLFVHWQVDITWTRGTSSLAFAMIGVMLAAERLRLRHAASEPVVQQPAPRVPRPLARVA